MKNGEDDFGWGMVVNFQKKANQSKVSVGTYRFKNISLIVQSIISITKSLVKDLLSFLIPKISSMLTFFAKKIQQKWLFW